MANERQILQVSELTRQIKGTLEVNFGDVWLEGEISNLRQPASGHYYLTLKDEKSQIKAVLFRYQISNLKFRPEDGLKVIVHGKVSVYEQRGEHQIILDTIEPAGLGALQLAFDQLKRKLQDEGLFDETHKKQIPTFPQHIGVVTSSTGAAFQDILNIIDRRFCNIHITLYPSRVQGDGSAVEISQAIEYFNIKNEVDVIIVGRGGGSLEDLWAFNEEVVARAIFNSNIPIISAVGHEIDFTISDFVADLRAPTPSAAAELVVQNKDEIKSRLENFRYQLINRLKNLTDFYRQRLDSYEKSAGFKEPRNQLMQRRQYIDDLDEKLVFFMQRKQTALNHSILNLHQRLLTHTPINQLKLIKNRYQNISEKLLSVYRNELINQKSNFGSLLRQLNALSPLSTLERGYAICWKLPEQTVVTSSSQVNKDDQVCVKISRGEIICRVEEAE